MASFTLIILAMFGLVGLAIMIVGSVLVVWAVLNDRRSNKED